MLASTVLDFVVTLTAFMLRCIARAFELGFIFADNDKWTVAVQRVTTGAISDSKSEYRNFWIGTADGVLQWLKNKGIVTTVMANKAPTATVFIFASACFKVAAVTVTLAARSSYTAWINDSLCAYEYAAGFALLHIFVKMHIWVDQTAVAMAQEHLFIWHYVRVRVVVVLSLLGSTCVFMSLIFAYIKFETEEGGGADLVKLDPFFELGVCFAGFVRVATCSPQWSYDPSLEFDRLCRILLLRAFVGGLITATGFAQILRNAGLYDYRILISVALSILEAILTARLGQSFYWNAQHTAVVDSKNRAAVLGIKQIVATCTNVTIIVGTLIQVMFFDQYLSVWLTGDTIHMIVLSMGVLACCISQWLQPRDAWRDVT